MPKITGWKRTVRRNLDEGIARAEDTNKFDIDLGRWLHDDGTEISFFRPSGEDWVVDEFWIMWKLPSGEKFRYTIVEKRVDAEKLCRDIQKAYSAAPIGGIEFANSLADRTWVQFLRQAEGQGQEAEIING